jgi:hypothetical protein
MAAILLTAFMAFVALAVDLGVIAIAHAQLQTVADAAALAGARQLAGDWRLTTNSTTLATGMTAAMTAARAKAIAIGQANSVLNHAAQINDNPTNSPSGDVVIGYIDESNTSSTLSTAAAQTTFNSVQVTATRSSDHVGVVPAFFSRVLGFSGSMISVQSTATVGISQIQGVNSSLGVNGNILPIAMFQARYNAMIASSGSSTTDQYAFNSSTYNPPSNNGVTSGSDGVYESVLYPAASDPSTESDWGTVSFDGTKNGGGAAALNSELLSGMSPADMQINFPTGSVQSSWFYAKPGMDSSMSTNLTSLIGKAVEILIYSGDNGVKNGANLQYDVVGLATVRIVAVNFQGSNKYVIVQPAIAADQTVIPASGPPSNNWYTGGAVVLHLSR